MSKLCSRLSFRLLFSQSLLTLDILEDILADKTEEAEKNQQRKGSKKVCITNITGTMLLMK